MKHSRALTHSLQLLEFLSRNNLKMELLRTTLNSSRLPGSSSLSFLSLPSPPLLPTITTLLSWALIICELYFHLIWMIKQKKGICEYVLNNKAIWTFAGIINPTFDMMAFIILNSLKGEMRDSMTNPQNYFLKN